MKISQKTKEKLYSAIREEIVSARIKMKLEPEKDYILAQLEIKIWSQQKKALRIPACF